MTCQGHRKEDENLHGLGICGLGGRWMVIRFRGGLELKVSGLGFMVVVAQSFGFRVWVV